MRQQKAYAVEQMLRGEPYVRGMLASDDVITAKEYVIKPKKLIADLFALIDNWASEGWTKNPEAVKDTVIAEINATNNSRLDAEFTDDEAKALRIIAVKAAFLY
jgi:phage tail sheath gpL-like